MDRTCPPTFILAAYNAIPVTDKTLLTVPFRGHQTGRLPPELLKRHDEMIRPARDAFFENFYE